MKLLFSLVLLFALPAGAQEVAPQGFDNLVAAGKLSQTDENPTSAAPGKNLEPAENLRRQRAAVKRNAPALQLLREALQQPIEVPRPQSPEEFAQLLESFAKFRELGRLLRQESAVRLADGDFSGAMDSRLTALDLGVSITKDAPLVGDLSGIAIEGVGRQDLVSVASHLDAVSCRAALIRMQSIDKRRSAFAEVLKVEKAFVLKNANSNLAQPELTDQMKTDLMTPEGRQKLGLTEAEAQRALNFRPQDYFDSLAKGMDDVIQRENLTYVRSQKAVLPVSPSPEVEMALGPFRESRNRFNHERNLTDQRLVEGALELRAIHLETGAYPEKFATPLDPFGDGTALIYEKEGQKYLLYSVGPDGKDEGGAEIVNLPAGGEMASNRLQATSLGDILAPIF